MGPSQETSTFPDSLFPLNRKITVILGAHDIKQEESTWQELEVKEQFVHPKYNYFTNVNDIMLLKVPFSFLDFSIPPS